MNATNEDSYSDSGNITLITTDGGSTPSQPVLVECNGIIYELRFDDKSSEEQSGGETISLTVADSQQGPIYLDPELSFAEEIPLPQIDLSLGADHQVDLTQPTPSATQEGETYANLGEAEENNFIDYDAISAAKFGTLTTSQNSEDIARLNAFSATNTDRSLSKVCIKLPNLPDTPSSALLSAEIISHELGSLTKVGLSSNFSKQDSPITVGDLVKTYSSEPGIPQLVERDELPHISWSNFVLPINTFLVVHPKIQFRIEESFPDRRFIFPSNTEVHGILPGVISHSADGLMVNSRTTVPIDQYFIESNSISEEMHQNQGGKSDFRGAQAQIQMFSIQRPNNSNPDAYVQDHTRLLYAIQPKGSISNHIVIVPSANSFNIPNINIVSESPLSLPHQSIEASLTTPSTSVSCVSNLKNRQTPHQLNLPSTSTNPKQSRKSDLKTPKTPKSNKPKQPRKRKSDFPAATTPVVVPEFSNDLISMNGPRTTNNNFNPAFVNDSTTTVVLSPVVQGGIVSQRVQCLSSSPASRNINSSSEFPQQYLIMSPSNFSQTPSGAQNHQPNIINAHCVNPQMILSSIQNSTQVQVLPTATNRLHQSYQQPNLQQQPQTAFVMTSGDQVSSTTSNAGITVPGGLGNISKLGNGKFLVQVSSPNSSSMMIGNSPSKSPVLLQNHTSVIRQPMFSPIQVNNCQFNRVNMVSGPGSPAPRACAPNDSASAFLRHQVDNPQYSASTTATPKIAVILEQARPTSAPTYTSPTTSTHTRKTNPAHRTQSQIESVTYSPVNVKDKPLELQSPVEEPVQDPFTRKRFIENHEVLCRHCGTRSRDLHFCEYCKTRISNASKLVPADPSSRNNNIEAKNFNTPVVQQQLGVGSTKKVSKKPTGRKSKGGGKRHEELIVLSSSEDEDQPKAKVPKSDNTNNKMDNMQSSASNSPAFGGGGGGKELKITLSPASGSSGSTSNTSNSQRQTYLVHEDEMDFEKLIEEISESLNSASKKNAVKVECRSIRVGDYKCSAPSPIGTEGYTVVFSERGIMFTLPHAQTKHKAVVCALPIDNILIVEANYKKTLPVIFLATGPRLAKSLRKLLGLSEDPKDHGLHYGPQDGDKCQKRIVFLFTTITEQAAATINKIFGRTLSEIDSVKANQILCDITRDPHVITTNTKKLIIGISKLPEKVPLTYPSNSSVIMSPKPANSNPINLQPPSSSQIDVSKNKKLLCYSEIDIQQQDVLCLADEQFLNDSILDFWLQYVEHEILPPEAKDRTYMFSTFFYKRLTTKPKKRTAIEDDPAVTPSEKRHSRVKRWTKNVDIFDKDFLIIPINESLHWFLAVICFPGLLGVHDMTTGEPIPDYQKAKKKPPKSKTTTSTKAEPVPNGFADNTGDPDIPSVSSSEGTSSQSQASQEEGTDQSSRAVKIKQPCILVFDSLAGDIRSRVYSTLREYLKMEYKTRKGEDREFTKSSMPGAMPKVPQQPNHCDCGIYTLFYVECFFKWPMSTFDLSSEDYFTVWANQTSCSTKREDIYKSIRELVKKTNPDALPLIPHLTFSPIPTRASQLTQIESAPVEKLEKIPEGQEPMDIDIGLPLPPPEPEETLMSETFLTSSTVESARASPADNDHDHDYAGVPTNST